jgi:hypothetical protein
MSLAQAGISRAKIMTALLSVVVLAASCNKQEKPQTAQNGFASPDDAAKALVAAAKSGNGDAVLAVLGPGSKDVVSSGDAAEDKADLTGFASDYNIMHRWRKLPNGNLLLITGTDNKTFPFPSKRMATVNGLLTSRLAKKKLGRARSEETSWRQWTSLGRLPTPSSNTSHSVTTA